MKGLKKAKTPKEIAKEHDVPLEDVIRQLEMGKEVEQEHTTNDDIARQIALHHLDELPTKYYSMLKKLEKMNEDLRNWFNPKHPDGGWKRINSKGEVVGPCARGSNSESKPKCMSNKKRRQLSKRQRAAAVKAKRRHDPVADRAGKGGKPINVSNFGKGRISEAMEYLEEKNVPTNPELWSKAKSLARSKFDVYPSAYANGWAAKWYKKHGGGWKKGGKKHKKKMNEQLAIFHRRKGAFLVDPEQIDPETGLPSTALFKYKTQALPLTTGEDSSDLIITNYDPTKEKTIKENAISFFYNKQFKKLIPEDHAAIESGEMVDDEGQMAANQLDTIQNAIDRLRGRIKGKKQQLPAWVQSKITKATDGIDTVADYMSSDSEEQLTESTSPLNFFYKNQRKKIQEAKKSTGPKLDKTGFPALLTPEEIQIKAALIRKIQGDKHRDVVWDGTGRPQITGPKTVQIGNEGGGSVNLTLGPALHYKHYGHGMELTSGNVGQIAAERAADHARAMRVLQGMEQEGPEGAAFRARQNMPPEGSRVPPLGPRAARIEPVETRRTPSRTPSSGSSNVRARTLAGIVDAVSPPPTSAPRMTPQEAARAIAAHQAELAKLQRAKLQARQREAGLREQFIFETKKPFKGFKKGKNHPEGGLSRAEARRQGIHAGIETKREAQKKGGFSKLSGKTQKRRKSFCSRMCGMKRRRTSAKTARDPKSKINAALRVWGCRCESYNPTCDVCDYEKQLLMHEEVVNKKNKGTMTKAEISRRDDVAKKTKPQPIKGDTDEESQHRIATYIVLRARAGKKKKAKK